MPEPAGVTPEPMIDEEWTPMSWQARPALQQPDYERTEEAEEALVKLRSLPPLVTSWEIETLKKQLAEATVGKRFLLQGGDCAESLADCTPTVIANKLKILLQMSLVLVLGAQKPVIRVGRIAGQYAKPRSSPTETREGLTLPSYFGDLINEADFSEGSRRPNPRLLVRGYQHAAMTLNFIRALIDGGFADLHHPEYWEMRRFDDPELHREYHDLVERVSESLRFMEMVSGSTIDKLSRVEFFTSHEGLNLLYESAATRTVPRRRGYYNLTTHFPWIGDRTRQLDGAHIEYFRGIRNPVGVKIGPNAIPDDLRRLGERLDPDREPGRLAFIHRIGVDQIEDKLPPLVDAMRDEERAVLWVCDPMHGNTKVTSDGRKTRAFDDILGELTAAFDLHERLGSVLGGVHFELTGDDVTECTGGASGLSERDLDGNYRSPCDPRLNAEQSLEMAFLIARRLRDRRREANGDGASSNPPDYNQG
ncbi:MAG: class II 3-deoxy-7-phosphoheptulonate synthase [Phycisphaerales bacterium]